MRDKHFLPKARVSFPAVWFVVLQSHSLRREMFCHICSASFPKDGERFPNNSSGLAKNCQVSSPGVGVRLDLAHLKRSSGILIRGHGPHVADFASHREITKLRTPILLERKHNKTLKLHKILLAPESRDLLSVYDGGFSLHLVIGGRVADDDHRLSVDGASFTRRFVRRTGCTRRHSVCEKASVPTATEELLVPPTPRCTAGEVRVSRAPPPATNVNVSLSTHKTLVVASCLVKI